MTWTTLDWGSDGDYRVEYVGYAEPENEGRKPVTIRETPAGFVVVLPGQRSVDEYPTQTFPTLTLATQFAEDVA